MKESDYNDFCKAWATWQEIGANGKVLSPIAMKAAFEIFLDFGIGEIKSALRQHAKTNRFAPTPADIATQLREMSESGKPRHLDADAAWAIALQSMDESKTVMVTDEILMAREMAMPIFESGDRIGARMAFRSAYERFLQNAKPPVWRVSLGHDQSQKREAIESFVNRGMLSRQDAEKLLPAPKEPEISFAKLTSMAEEKINNDAELREKWRTMKLVLAQGAGNPARDDDKQRFSANKAGALAKITDRLGAGWEAKATKH